MIWHIGDDEWMNEKAVNRGEKVPIIWGRTRRGKRNFWPIFRLLSPFYGNFHKNAKNGWKTCDVSYKSLSYFCPEEKKKTGMFSEMWYKKPVVEMRTVGVMDPCFISPTKETYNTYRDYYRWEKWINARKQNKNCVSQFLGDTNSTPLNCVVFRWFLLILSSSARSAKRRNKRSHSGFSAQKKTWHAFFSFSGFPKGKKEN